MTDIDKIMAEIKRRRNAIIDFPVNHTVTLEAKCAIRSMTNGLLSFIESLGKEQPKGLDEAAEKYGMWRYAEEEPLAIRNFKAGAKWMEEQGEIHDSLVWQDEDNKLFIQEFVKDPQFKMADKVIVQIRKKEE